MAFGCAVEGKIDRHFAFQNHQLTHEVHMRRLIITAIDKNPRDDRHEHIKRFGGYDLATLQHWEASFDEAILMAKNPYVEFFVRGTRGLIPVGLFLSAYRNLCLRSDPNGVDADNLLSLPPLTALNSIELANALMRHGNQASNGIGLVRSTNRNFTRGWHSAEKRPRID